MAPAALESKSLCPVRTEEVGKLNKEEAIAVILQGRCNGLHAAHLKEMPYRAHGEPLEADDAGLVVVEKFEFLLRQPVRWGGKFRDRSGSRIVYNDADDAPTSCHPSENLGGVRINRESLQHDATRLGCLFWCEGQLGLAFCIQLRLAQTSEVRVILWNAEGFDVGRMVAMLKQRALLRVQ